MVVKNKVDEIKAESDEVMAFLQSIGNPEIEEHVNTLPIPPQAKEFFVGLTKTVVMLARKFID